MVGWLTETTTRSIQHGTNKTCVLAQRVLVLQITDHPDVQRSGLPGSKKKPRSELTHSQPVGHSAISYCAHTPGAKSKASETTLERNPRVITIEGTSEGV